MRSQKDLMVQTADLHPAKANNGMQRTRNQHVSHARLVVGGGSCAPLMPSVMLLPILATMIRLMWVLIEYPYLRRFKVQPIKDWDKHSSKLWDVANLIEPV